MTQIRLTEEQKQKIINRFKEVNSVVQVSKEFNRCRESVRYLLKKRELETPTLSVARRRHLVDESFFDKIDTEEKAYFLGLMYADGYNSRRYNAIMITLQERDKGILETFKCCLGTNKPLSLIVNKKENQQNYYKLTIHSKRLSEALEDKGCMQAKSFKITFPNFLQDSLKRHFIRGYIDGDGYLGKNVKDPVLSFTSNKTFCESLVSFFKYTFDVHCTLNIRHTQSPNIMTVLISGIYQVKKILDFLYKDATIFIERKYEVYENVCNYINIKNQPKPVKYCKEEDCSNTLYAKGLCQHHYEKVRWIYRKQNLKLWQ